MKTINSLAGAIALVIATTAAAQGVTQKPVTGADRKKATAPATTAKPTTSTETTGETSATAAQPVTPPDEPAAPQSSAPGQTGNTPGQAQTGPGQASDIAPAQTGTTPSGQTTGNAPPATAESATTTTAPALTAATPADVKKGVEVYDKDGALVGKIESATGKDAVVSTGTTRASIALSSFAKNDKGLVLGMTKAELEAASKPPAKK